MWLTQFSLTVAEQISQVPVHLKSLADWNKPAKLKQFWATDFWGLNWAPEFSALRRKKCKKFQTQANTEQSQFSAELS